MKAGVHKKDTHLEIFVAQLFDSSTCPRKRHGEIGLRLLPGTANILACDPVRNFLLRF